jgi:hypothetical protein
VISVILSFTVLPYNYWMLRNSTQQFKEKYEKNGLIAYWSSDLLASRKKELLPNQKQAMNATWTKNAKISSCSAKKL